MSEVVTQKAEAEAEAGAEAEAEAETAAEAEAEAEVQVQVQVQAEHGIEETFLATREVAMLLHQLQLVQQSEVSLLV